MRVHALLCAMLSLLLVQVAAEVNSTEAISVKHFFSTNEIAHPTLSPNGQYVAFLKQRVVLAGNETLGYRAVDTLDNMQIGQLSWSGPQQLSIRKVDKEKREQSFSVIDVDVSEGKLVVQNETTFAMDGYVMDFVPDNAKQLVFATFRRGKGGLKSDIYRINPYKEFVYQKGRKTRLNGKFDKASKYLLSTDGKPLVGWGFEKKRPVLYLAGGANKTKWRRIWVGEEGDVFTPVKLSDDEKMLYVLTNSLSDTTALATFSLADRDFSKLLFAHDSVDVQGALVDDNSGKLLAASYFQGGLLTYHFFDNAQQAVSDWVQQSLGISKAHIIERSYDNDAFLVYAQPEQKSAAYYHCVKRLDRCDLVAHVRPRLNDIDLAQTVELTVDTKDGLQIQSFLTLPTNIDSEVPLVVMPHGGPIGVQDVRFYDGDVQWLAYNGYAVLQVNYRGSAGFGKTFKSAGLRQWGRGIEDDIELSLQNALTRYAQLSRDRICIYGGSYGGYSAVMSIIRFPDRYRCAASYAGVMDLSLLFSPQRVQQDREVRESLIRMIGDPEQDKEQLKTHSPVYNYKKIGRPVFLAHGNNDNVVDVEHSWRLHLLLRKAQQPTEIHVLQGVGHSFRFTTEVEKLYTPLLLFLNKHLKD